MRELGAEITRDYDGREPLLVGSLKASLVFISDLSRAMPTLHALDFIELAGYGSAARTQPLKHLVEITDREHDTEVAERVDRGVAVICDDIGGQEAGELDAAVAGRCAHHGNLDARAGKSGDTSCPLSFDRGAPFQLKAKLLEKINRLSEVLDDDSHVIHPFERHASRVQDAVNGIRNDVP